MMQADQPVVEDEAVENEDEEDEAETENETETEDEAVAEVEYETEDDNEDDNEDESDIKLAFIATRSGLMRFKEEFDDDNDEQAPFADDNNKAIEEIWYKRAVDYDTKNPNAIVYSVPFNIGKKRTQVTASYAIMLGEGDKKSPAAVAGMQLITIDSVKCFMVKLWVIVVL